MRTTWIARYSVCVLVLLAVAGVCYGDSAEVMPKGVFGASLESYFYFPITTRFDENGNEESVATDFNATLGSNIFPDLGLLEEALGLRPGSANIGTSVVSFKYDIHEEILNLHYGLTDRLTLGVKLPYAWATNHVKSRLDTTKATFGLNPLFGNPNVPQPINALPLIPLSLPLPNGQVVHGTPLTTAQVKDLLSGGLDVNGDGKVDIPGFKFKRFQSWSDEGMEDLEAGFRFQYLNTKDWRLAFTGGARFPTGRTNDPDDLNDLAFGSGTYALLFRLNNDYTGIKNLLLNTTIRYDLRLPDSSLQRIPRNVDEPLTRVREVVERDLGDSMELEGSARYQIFEGFALSFLYRYAFKVTKDDVRDSTGAHLSSLEDLTDWTYHMIRPGICYSTLPLFKQKKFPVPLTVSLEYENVFSGTNRFLKQEDFLLTLSVFF
jgi:hypothetical protein